MRKILGLLQGGGGPEAAFRPYLLTAVRRATYDRHRAERGQIATDQRLPAPRCPFQVRRSSRR